MSGKQIKFTGMTNSAHHRGLNRKSGRQGSSRRHFSDKRNAIVRNGLSGKKHDTEEGNATKLDVDKWDEGIF